MSDLTDPDEWMREQNRKMDEQRLQAKQQGNGPTATDNGVNAAPAAVQPPQRPSVNAILSPGLTWPPGFVGAIAHYIYDSAIRPVPEVAIVSALGLLSGICGKAWITTTNAGLNQYIILIARSAIGKEAMHSGISTLMNYATKEYNLGNPFVDFSDFASGQALIKACAENPSFVNITGEFGHKLKQIAGSTNKPDSPMQTLRRVMTNLYSKSEPKTVAGGIKYSDKDKNVSSVEGVAYSLLGETTPDTFYDLLTHDMMADGLLSRFTMVEYEGDRPEPNKGAMHFSEPWKEMLDYLKALISQAFTLLTRFETQTVQYYDETAQTMFDDFEIECDRQINSTHDEAYRQMWNRAHLKALKIAALCAVGDECLNPMITTVHAEWAIEFIKRDIAVFTKRLQSGDIGAGDDARESKLIAIANEYILYSKMPKSFEVFYDMKRDFIIPHSYLQQRTQKLAAFKNHRLGATKSLNEAIHSILDAGYFVLISRREVQEKYGYHGKVYRLKFDGENLTPEPKNREDLLKNFWKYE